MAFGISGGFSKTKSTTKVNKTETTNQAEDSTKASSGVTSTSGTSATQSSQQGSQTGQTTGSTTGNQSSTQTGQQYSDAILGQLEGVVGTLFNQMPSGEDLKYTSGFNATDYVNSGMEAAQSQIQSQVDESLNGMFDNIGGRDDSNSMAALLAGRVRGEAAANLAGTRAQLGAQAEDINRKNFEANLAGASAQQGFIGSVLQALKGGVSTQTGNVATTENTAGTSAQQTSQTASENTQTQQTQIQQLIEQLNSIMSGTSHVVGTEKTKGSQIGGGASLSL